MWPKYTFSIGKALFLLLQVNRMQVFMGDFGTNGAAAFKLDLWVSSVLVGEN